ncbi:MAG TPA: M48 family metalloprotease, partial [Actinomycetes bacterium]|nr:M48 family metalloprotease [Actinomycetes bacterium]
MASQHAGWHPCPSGLDQERYWDGRSWTSSVRPNSTSASYDSRTRPPRMFPEPSFVSRPTSGDRIPMGSLGTAWPGTPGVFGGDDADGGDEADEADGGDQADSADEADEADGAATDDNPDTVARRPGGGTLLTLLPLAVLVLAAAMIVIPIVSWLWRQSEFWTVILIGGWIAIGAAHFVKPTQGLVAYRLYRAREPTPDERAKLHEPWQNVLARAGIPADRYRLMVSDRDDVNAYASGGYGVVVTSLAVRRLRPRQLEAVLAHELGHHLNLDLVPRVLMQQVLLPIRAVWWLGRALWTAIRAVGRGALASPSCLSVLLVGIVAIVALLLFRSLVAPAVIAL